VISNTTVNSGGFDQISDGGSGSGTTVNSGGFEQVFSGGVASGTVVASSGLQVVLAGTAISTVVSQAGEQIVDFPGGNASATTVLSGGMLLNTRGTVTNAVLSSGASATISNFVSAAGFAVGTTVLSGAVQTLKTGGASGTVLNGGEEIVFSFEDLALVNSGGLEFVEGGTLLSATISGGTVEISGGGRLSGTASFATSGGGTLQLDQAIDYGSGGAVISGFGSGDVVDFRAIGFSGSVLSWNQGTGSGTLSVSSGGANASMTLLGNYAGGQTLSVTNGQTSVGLIVQSGASPQFASAIDSAGGTDVTFSPVFENVFVSGGGVASNTIVNNGGFFKIFPGGVASGTKVFSGGIEITAFGTGKTTGTVVFNGGEESVAGTAISTLVSSGGVQSVFAGVASDTTVLSGGLLNVQGKTINAVLSAGGSAIIGAAINTGIASGTTVLSGATQNVNSGTASGTVLNGGREIVSGTGETEQLALVNSGGLEFLSNGGLLDSATISGGTVEIGNGGRLSGTASFATSGGGTLQLDQAINYASAGAVVSGFTSGADFIDFIDFLAVGYSAGVTTSTWTSTTSASSGTLTVISGGTSASILLLGNYAAGQFTLASDGNGGTRVSDPPLVAQADLLTNPHST
jgi:autotransporter passenger strand-loop-strand repeat protein